MTLITANAAKAAGELVQRAETARSEIIAASKPMRMFLVGAARQQLLDMFTPEVMQMIMPLQNTPLGFMSDKPEGYPADIVKRVAAEAYLSGLFMADNEVNIIGGRLYATKNGCRRLVEEFPGVSNVRFQPGIPELAYGEPIKKQGRNGEYTVQRCVAYVPCRLEYTLNGKQVVRDYQGDYRIVCKIDGGAEDMAIGKAERKAFKREYESLCGLNLGDDADDNVIDVKAQPAVIETEQMVRPDLLTMADEFAACKNIDQLEERRKEWRTVAKEDQWSKEELAQAKDAYDQAKDRLSVPA